MITRKENLLTQPFQSRNFIRHRQRVNNALPRIDDITPPFREHVYIKSKKLQNEHERQSQIERDNFILLKHLNDIMTAKRIDNTWLCKLPKFQNRIKLFHSHPRKVVFGQIPKEEKAKNSSLKDKCIACHPETYLMPPIIPEERIPWETKPLRRYTVDFQYEKYSKTEDSKKYTGTFTKETRIPEIPASKCKQISNNFRNKTAPTGKSRTIQMTSMTRNRPLTVIMKFPTSTNVKLDAGLGS